MIYRLNVERNYSRTLIEKTKNIDMILLMDEVFLFYKYIQCVNIYTEKQQNLRKLFSNINFFLSSWVKVNLERERLDCKIADSQRVCRTCLKRKNLTLLRDNYSSKEKFMNELVETLKSNAGFSRCSEKEQRQIDHAINFMFLREKRNQHLKSFHEAVCSNINDPEKYNKGLKIYGSLSREYERQLRKERNELFR